MYIHGSGALVLVNVSKDQNGHYQCQVNESGAIINGSSYVLSVQNQTDSLIGKKLQTSCTIFFNDISIYKLILHNHLVSYQVPLISHLFDWSVGILILESKF